MLIIRQGAHKKARRELCGLFLTVQCLKISAPSECQGQKQQILLLLSQERERDDDETASFKGNSDETEWVSQYFSLSWNVAAIAMSLEGPLHEVINCASIDKNWGEQWIILFASKGIIEACEGIWKVYYSGTHHQFSIGKDHPCMCVLWFSGGSVIKALFGWSNQGQQTNSEQKKFVIWCNNTLLPGLCPITYNDKCQ